MFYTSNNIKADFLAEELFHAYQDAYYPGGIEQYTKGDMKGRSNLDFEAKFFNDLMCKLVTGVCPPPTINLNYTDLLNEILDYYTANGVFPTSFTNEQQKEYFLALEKFKKDNPKYNYPSNDLLPNAAFEILNKATNCGKVKIIEVTP